VSLNLTLQALLFFLQNLLFVSVKMLDNPTEGGKSGPYACKYRGAQAPHP
jgi:hypothetical protein